MPREDDPCKHAYPTRAQCPICSKEPEKSQARIVVYITEGGSAYHYDRNCHALAYGQKLVEERGGTPAPIRTTFEDLVKHERPPCNSCKSKRPAR